MSIAPAGARSLYSFDGSNLACGAEPYLVCFPYAGGSAQLFRPWSNALAGISAVLAVEYPGRGRRYTELAPQEPEALALEIAQEILLTEADNAVLFGHSMGALLAYLVAITLTREARPPRALVVSAYQAPHCLNTAEAVHELQDSDFVDHLRKINGTPSELLDDDESLALVLPIIRADFRLCARYRHGTAPVLPCAIVALGGLSDPLVDRGGLMGWRDCTSSRFELIMFPGDHFFLHTAAPAVVTCVAQQMRKFAER
ncbi:MULTISPECIES: thioesterase II family protein [unclassified Bradyrhizobium]|uniref:thioesterase II family protein n=1 Tax=unclassified Bradyrhizobium TaxID=2631580 RepID=UPI002915F8A4|nr:MULTISPECIES: alpha/beta fold hydrolase [unclassified Bradyrhizobium]